MLKNYSESRKNLFYRIAFSLIVFTTVPNYYSQTLTAEKIYKKVSDAVVVIYAYDSNNLLSKQGSGVVINDKGYVVTNYHVAGNDKGPSIDANKRVAYVDIIGIDVEKDILILKIEEKKFPAITIGDSKSLNIGQRVYAIGSPLGFENTISEGIISGLRSYEEVGKNFIQITASISPGSSGGAVVNEKGQLIGISTLTAKEGQNLNFAIPIDDVLSVEINSYSKNNAYKNFEWFSKGNDEYENGNYEEAILYYSFYIKKYPEDSNAYYNRGLTKLSLDDYKEAIQDFNKAIGFNQSFAIAYMSRGVAKYFLGDLKGAIRDYDKSIAINPNQTSAYTNRGHIKSDLGDYEGALKDYNKVIEISPNDAAAYNNRGNIKADLGDYRGAIQDYSKAIEIDPNDGFAYYNRGYKKFKFGDKEGACLDWSKAGELGLDNAYDMIRENCN